MPTLQEILRDPNYINANPATKQAIFERWAPQDTNFTSANAATQAAIRQRFGVGMAAEPEPQPQEESGFLRQAADVPLSVGKGALSGVRMIADAFGAGSKASQAIKGAEGYLSSLMSAQAKNDEQEIARIMKDAEDKGVLDQVKAGLQAFTVAPVDLVSQGLGTAAPAVLGLLGGKVLGAGALGARAIGAGIGAAMGAGTAKGGIYEATKEELVKAGLPEDQAEKRAQEAQAYGGKNLDQILLSTGLGAFASSTGLEGSVRRILARGAAKQAAKESVERGLPAAAKAIGKGTLAEAAPEFVQAGQEQVAQNIALQREGFDVPTFRGAVGSGTLEALAGAGLGAGFSAAEVSKGGLRAKAKEDAAKILEQERAAQEPAPAITPAVREEPETSLEDIERAAGIASVREEPQTVEDLIAEEPVAKAPEATPALPAAMGETVEKPTPEPTAIEAQPEAPARQNLQDLIRNQEPATEYDTPENRLRESDAFGQDLPSLIKDELESYGRAAIKNRKLTEKAMDMRETWAAASDAATIAFATGDYERFKPYERLFTKTAAKLKSEIGKVTKLAKADEKALAEIDKPFSIAEEMEGVPAPLPPEIEAEVGKLTEDQAAAIAERENLEKRTAGTSLIQVLRGTLNDGELSELGGRARKVGKNPFLNLKAPKGRNGASMEDMVNSGKLDIFLPENKRPDHPDYENSESAEYIREKLRNNQYYTYDTEHEIKRISQDIESIERRIQELLSDDDINKEIQYAVNEQRELDQAAEEPATEGAPGTPEQREAKTADEDLARREAQLDREQELNEREARLLEERKRLEEERLKLEQPTKQDIIDKEELRKAKERAEQERKRADEEKAKADEAAADFVLTGSDRAADEAEARGQQPMFAAEKGQTGYSIDPEEQRVEKELTGKTMVQAADWAIQNAPNAFLKTIAEKVRNRLRDLERRGVKLEFEVFGGDRRPASLYGARGYMQPDWGNDTKGTTLRLVLNGAAVMNNQAGYPPGTRYSTVLHELLHVATRGYLQFAPLSDPLRRQMRDLTNAIIDRFNADAKAGKLPPVMQKYYKRMNNVLESDDEVLAWGLTDEDVQKYYADIKVGEKSAMTRLVELVRSVLGLGKPYESALDRLVKVSESMLDMDISAVDAVLGNAGKRLGRAAPTTGEQQALFQKEAVEFREDIPNERWLQEKIDYAQRQPRNEFGVPKMSSVTGYFKGPVMVPARWLKDAKGQRGEEKNVRQKDLEAIRKIIRETGKFPLNDDGTEYVPYIEIGYDGKPWVSEGNHRIMAAIAEGMEYIPIELRYFDGGQRRAGVWGPGNVAFATENAAAASGDSLRQQEGRQNVLGEVTLGNWTMQPDTKLDTRDPLIYKLLDKNIDLKRVINAIKGTGREIATRWNPYLQEELYHGRTAKQTQDFMSKEVKPLIEEMDRDGVTIGEFEQYLHNRHAEAYNKHVAKVNPNTPEMQDGGSGITTEAARKYLADLPAEKKKVYESLAKRIDEMTKGTRELLVESGLEKRETIEAWEKAFPDYVPLMREEEDFEYTTNSFGVGQGFDVRGSFSKRAMGSKRNVVDILANAVLSRERAIVKAEKNRVAQAVYGLAIQNGNPDFWMAVNPMAEKIPQVALDDLARLNIGNDALEFLMKEPRQRAIDPKKNEVISRINSRLRDSKYVLSMRLNGENRYVFFNPNNERAKRAATALKNLDAQQLGTIMGFMGRITRFMSAMNTQYNPIFGAYNFLRDVQGAAFQLSTTPIAGKQKEVGKNVLPAMKAIFQSLRKGEPTDTEMGKLWEDFQKAGGQTGFRDMYSRSQDRAEALLDEFKKMSEGRIKKAGRYTFQLLSDYNDTMENAVRLSAYKVALENGFNKDEAASIAKNLTVNFNRKGDIAVQAGALYAFFNASMQGTARLIETLKGPLGKKIVYGGLLWGVMQSALLAMAGFDEEEPPEFVRERNFIIPIFGTDKYLAFPMPLGYHVIPGTSRSITDAVLASFGVLKSSKTMAERVTDLTGMFLEAFNPIGNAGWSFQTLAFTPFDPIVALFENKDWTGKKISKQDFSDQDPTPGYTRAKESATYIGTQIAKFINLATGGTKYQPGIISPTPEQLEYLAGQAFGGVGREVGKIVTTAEKLITGEELPPYKIPLAGRFYGETKSSAAEASRFYKNLQHLNKLENEINGRRDNKEPMGTFMADNPEARLIKRAESVYNDVKKLRERKEKLVERGASRESVKVVEEQITRKMRLLNEQVENAKK